MRVGILGSGLMGAKLGTIFARVGHDVIFSYSRDEKKLQSWRANPELGRVRPQRRHETPMPCCLRCIGHAWTMS
jgi:predicted dinucleotide-binding enzyme